VRTAAAIVVTAGLALTAAACGGSSGNHVARLATTTGQVTSAASPQDRAVAFAHCMRSHEVPNWPDPEPDSNGVFDKSKLTSQRLGASLHRVQAAQAACNHLLPNGGRGPNLAQIRHVTAEARSFARCVRAHGVPNFPDPGSDGRIPDPATVGVDQGSPKFQAANQACRKDRPPYIPSNAAYDEWARTHGR